MSMKNILLVTLSSLTLLHADWNFPSTNLSDTDHAENIQLAVSSSGKAVATWLLNDIVQIVQYDGTIWKLSAVNISDESEDSIGPVIGIDSSGKAIIAWTNDTQKIIQATQFDGTSQIFPLINLSDPGQEAESVDLSVNSNGKALAVWARNDGANNIIQAAQFNGAEWVLPASNLSISSQSSKNPHIAINSNGKGVAVWEQTTTSGSIIQASTFNGIEWKPFPTNLSIDGGLSEKHPQVSINSSGQAVAIWERFNGSEIVVQAATFNGNNWELPSKDIASSPSETKPQVCISSSGKILATWIGHDGIGKVVQSAFYNGSVWSSITTISNSPGVTPANVQLTTDPNCNAVAVWEMGDIVQAATWDGLSWTQPINLTESAAAAHDPQVGLDSSNNTIAAWIGIEGSFDTAQAVSGSNFFSTGFTGFVAINQFFTQTNIMHKVNWQPSTNPSVNGYRIYQGNTVVAEIPTSGPLEATIHNRAKGHKNTYHLVAFDKDNNEGNPQITSVQ